MVPQWSTNRGKKLKSGAWGLSGPFRERGENAVTHRRGQERPRRAQEGPKKSPWKGPVVSGGHQNNRFGEKAVRARRFVFDCGEKRENRQKCENRRFTSTGAPFSGVLGAKEARIVVLLQREHHFQGSRGGSEAPFPIVC